MKLTDLPVSIPNALQAKKHVAAESMQHAGKFPELDTVHVT